MGTYYSAESDEEALDQLLKPEFRREGLPEVLGGTETWDDMLLWLRQRGYDSAVGRALHGDNGDQKLPSL